MPDILHSVIKLQGVMSEKNDEIKSKVEREYNVYY